MVRRWRDATAKGSTTSAFALRNAMGAYSISKSYGKKTPRLFGWSLERLIQEQCSARGVAPSSRASQEACMATKSKSGNEQQQSAGEANLGQNEARKAQQSDASLQHMGDNTGKAGDKAKSGPAAKKSRANQQK